MRSYFLLLIISVFSTLAIGCQPFAENEQEPSAYEIVTKLDRTPNEKMAFEIEENQHIAKVDEESGLHVVDNPESILVYVNKQRMLPDGYDPTDLVDPDVAHSTAPGDERRLLRDEAAQALEALFSHAEEEGMELVAISGYRSYQRQTAIYANNVATRGQEHADQFSASPGTSEHQTGLAMDISAASVSLGLNQTFKQTDEGAWAADHAHLHGYILRYPEGKTHITGYAYEPWHFRYIGQELATKLYESEITLEEYFGYDY